MVVKVITNQFINGIKFNHKKPIFVVKRYIRIQSANYGTLTVVMRHHHYVDIFSSLMM